MAQIAIVHTATRVIRRVTETAPPRISADETAVTLAANIDIAGSFWKLDVGNNKVSATLAEMQAAGWDGQDFNPLGLLAAQRKATLLAACDAVGSSSANAATKAFAAALKAYLG